MTLANGAPPTGDPLDWDTEQVVAFLCHRGKAPWSQSSIEPPRPDPSTFGNILRENLVTGDVLLHDIDKQTLREDLGLKKIGHWSTILAAIRYLREVSQKYRNVGTPDIPSPERNRSAINEDVILKNVNEGDTDSFEPLTPPLPNRKSADGDEVGSRPRPREYSVVDRQGRKRRKLELNVAPPPATRNESASEVNVQDKDWYMGPNKVSQSDLFYPLNSDDQDEKEFTMFGSSFPVAQHSFVKGKLHHFYRQQPIDLGSKEGSKKWAILPYKKSTPQDKAKLYFTLYSSKNGKVSVHQEEIDKYPELREREAAYSDAGVGLSSSDPFSYLIQKYPAEENDERALPAYGDSGSEGEYDEETWLEMSKEQNDGSSRWLSSAEVKSVVSKCVDEFRKIWHEHHRPKAERKARGIWMGARLRKSSNQQIKDISRDIQQLEKRLAKFKGAILEGEYTTTAELHGQCFSLEETVFNIESQKWKVSVLEQPVCPPRVADVPKPRPVRRQKQKQDIEDSESLHSESESDPDAALADFVVDDSDVGNPVDNPVENPVDEPVDNEIAAEPSPPTRSRELSPAENRKSHDPRIPSPTPDNSQDNSKRSQWNAASDAVFSLGQSSQSSSRNSPSYEIVDLTVDSPQLEPEDQELTIETPPLNPTVPRQLSLVTTTMKVERDQSMSPSPDLGPRETSDRSKDTSKDTNKKGKSKRMEGSGIDFEGISKMEWSSLEERRDRRRLLAKLVHGLAYMECKQLYDKIDRHPVALLQKYVFFALAALKEGRTDIPKVDESDQMAVKRIASFYISWTNCKHYDGESLPKKAVKNALDDTTSFASFEKELVRCLVELEKAHYEDGQGTGSDSADGLGESSDSRLTSMPHKKRKREVKESQEVKKNHKAAQLRVAVQEEQRKLLGKRFEGVGLNSKDPTHQVVSFGDPIICLHPRIGSRIKPHQLTGIQFMWRELIEDENRKGCVLAHTMGLGKTMQV